MRLIPLFAAALLVTACEGEAERQVRMTLTDPDSAQFRDVRPCYGNRSIITGQVNAKNRMGGYVGYRQFYVLGDAVSIPENGNDPNPHLWERCYDLNPSD